MKLTRLKWAANHPILKGLDINLLKQDDTPYKNIIIAGDNGLGKTTILQSISDMFEGAYCDFESFEYTLAGKSYIATHAEGDHFQLTEVGGSTENVQFTHYRHQDPNVMDFGEISSFDNVVPQTRKASFSRAITSFTGAGIAEQVKDLLITLDRQDNEEYRTLARSQESSQQPVQLPSQYDATMSRIQRFRNAFNLVFGNPEFIGVRTSLRTTEVLFSKNQQAPYDIEHLSTGEKQIIFRGSSLLEGTNDTTIALIDEPELSMHPLWQSKLFDYYRSLFRNPVTQQQDAQIFFATHSDRIIASAINDPDTLIIRLKNDNGTLLANPTGATVLNTPSPAEINYLAFGICSIEYHILLFSQLHNTIALNRNLIDISIKDTDQSITQQAAYQQNVHAKQYAYTNRNGNTSTYDTLPTYVRNCIDHPGAPNPNTGQVNNFSELELATSTELLRALILEQKNNTYQY